MNMIAVGPRETLPLLINRAVSALENARSSADVLEARDMAKTAYDAAKSHARMHSVKSAHDSLMAEWHRSQAYALAIRTRAEMRLADEYDAAQDRGEVATGREGRGLGVSRENAQIATAADLGLARKDIHEARQFRDAEKAEPGLISRALDAMIGRGEEPTRAALKREVIDRPQPKKMNQTALALWGRVKDFERLGFLRESPGFLVNEMTDPMRADMRQFVPQVRAFLQQLEREL